LCADGSASPAALTLSLFLSLSLSLSFSLFLSLSLSFSLTAVALCPVAQEAAEKGHPLARAMWMHYPGDSTAATLKHQFLLGADLLMAPVLDQNVSKVHVYLPWLPAADSWRDAVRAPYAVKGPFET
jgi:hypothetical protein